MSLTKEQQKEQQLYNYAKAIKAEAVEEYKARKINEIVERKKKRRMAYNQDYFREYCDVTDKEDDEIIAMLQSSEAKQSEPTKEYTEFENHIIDQHDGIESDRCSKCKRFREKP